MNLSIRNRLPATVVSITPGAVMATVKARLNTGDGDGKGSGDGNGHGDSKGDGAADRADRMITAAVTLEAVEELGLAPGSQVTALVKATEVSLATGPVAGISIRNQLPGTVTAVSTGGAMATVKLTLDDPSGKGGAELTAAVTKEAVQDLGLTTGSPVVALIKSTELALAGN